MAANNYVNEYEMAGERQEVENTKIAQKTQRQSPSRLVVMSLGVLDLVTIVMLVALTLMYVQFEENWRKDNEDLKHEIKDLQKADNQIVLELHRLNLTDGRLFAKMQRNANISADQSGMVTSLVIAALGRLYTSNGWTASRNYMFKRFSERVDHSIATQRCMNLGGRLATDVLRHRDAARHIIAERYVIDQSTAPWVGYDDIQTEGSWNWIDGGSMNPNTTEWGTGQPSDSGGNENCAHIAATTATMLVLSDIICSWKLHYICEIEVL